jgi:hypothetical protein
MMATRELLSLRGRLGIATRLATEDKTEMTRAARIAASARFEAEVDPKSELSTAERSRRADAAQRAHMARLALASVKARRDRARQEAPIPLAGRRSDLLPKEVAA